MLTPYYQEAGIEIYHGDCREILPSLPEAECVITDPVYPRLDYGWEYVPIETLGFHCRQFYFWMLPPEPFPLPFTALHVWSKANVYIGTSELWEPIYEVNGQRVASVLREPAILPNYVQYKSECQPHPTQKPAKLMKRLAARTTGVILDPFMGSGTTLRAAKDLGRKAIGIEIEEKYCEIAANRLRQGVLTFDSNETNVWKVVRPAAR